ncbi:MAG: hypothetical protein JSS11_06055 [Verrucomicrobia bacterium]|nr:hypothetical protein [Verrucomicrobiota bacterium]
MNASFALTRYLWAELRLRWRAQPASPLARLLLTFALTAAAGIFVAGFAAAEAARRAELGRLGLDTMVLRAPAAGELTAETALPADHWARALRAEGSLLLLQQLPAAGLAPWGQAVPVMVAPWAEIARQLPPDGIRTAGAMWLSRTLAPGRRITVTHEGASFTAVTARPLGRWQALGLNECVLIPAGEGQGGAGGRLDVILFTPASEEAAVEVARQVQALFQAEHLEPPSIQDPGPVRRALAAFSRGQALWRTIMVFALGACVLLMFASLGMLEERQTRFTQALLRSLGVSSGVLWLASLLENLLLANLALILAFVASRAGAGVLLTLAGVEPGAASALSLNSFLGLACAVNAGVLLSLLPLWRALRLPVGAVLP